MRFIATLFVVIYPDVVVVIDRDVVVVVAIDCVSCFLFCAVVQHFESFFRTSYRRSSLATVHSFGSIVCLP